MLSPAAPKLNASALNLAAKGQNGAAPAGQVILPNNLTLLDCSPEGEGGLLRTILEDRESILHLIEAISRGNLASPSASAANLFQRTESGMDVYFRTGLPVESANPKAMAGRYRMDGINGSPTQAGGDPLRKAVLDNVNNGMVLHCVAVENAKNIPFIFSLSTSRLGARNAGATLHSQNATNCAADAAGNKNGSEDKGKEVGRDGKELDQRILSAQTDPYTDEAEYLERHLDRSEGDLVTDLDFELPIDVQKTEERKTRNVKKDNSIFARWPKSIEGLALGRRVDALDHRGQWFAGTVMDKWNVSSEELQELAEKTNSSSSSNNSSNNNITAGKGRGKSKEATTPTRHGSNTMINRDKDRNKGPKAAGWNIRIHFDSFSDKWDEWFSSADYDVKRVSPIYSFSTRKLKVIGVVVVQRQITLRNQGPGSAGSDTSNQEVLNVKVFGYPVVLRCESFRSCEHVHRLVAEQSMRYAQPGQLKDIAEASLNRYNSKKSQSQTSDIVHSKSSSEQLELPFTVRIISMTSALTADNLEGLDTELGIEGRKSVISKATAERQKEPHKWNAGLECVTGAVPIFSSVMDRANGFQAWEGSYFPRDPVRPLCNLVHPKLLVVVDWHWNATRAPAAGQGRGCLAYRDHESFLKYLSAFIPPAMPAASVGMSRSASVKDTEANGAPGAPTEPPPNPSARSPISSGNPTLADCLKSFTGSEELDEDSWHCDHCKKLSCGSVSSSLSRLPDLLIMHIKRFGMTARFREKIRTKVTFPLTSLNMKPFTTPLTAAGEN